MRERERERERESRICVVTASTGLYHSTLAHMVDLCRLGAESSVVDLA